MRQNKNNIDKNYFEVLIHATNQMLTLDKIEEAYDFIGTFLSDFIPNSIIILNDVVIPNEKVKTIGLYGVLEDTLQAMQKLVGFDPFNKIYDLSPNHVEFINSEKLIDFERGLYEFSDGNISKNSSAIIEKVLSINKIYTIGITKDYTAYASLHIFTLRKSEVKEKKMVELFLKQAGIILQQKKSEMLIKEQFDQLNNLYENQEVILSVIGHDLRSPFSSISGIAKILLQTANNEDDIEMLSLIKNSSHNASIVLENLLLWSQSDNKKLQVVKINLNEIADSNINLLKIISSNKGIKIKNHVTNSTLINTDLDMLNTIIRNLLANAIKYSYEGSEISISTTTKDDHTIISIKDSGVGISSEKINNIFSVQSNKATYGTKDEKGTGFGLLVCKKFIDIMGGEIWVESEENKGSTFSFTIPNKY